MTRLTRPRIAWTALVAIVGLVIGASPLALATPSGRAQRPQSWLSVAGGSHYTCGIRADSSLWCWGWNAFHQLGDGTRTTRLRPERIGTSAGWAEVSAGQDSTCAVKVDGSLWCWGNNDAGQLGTGDQHDAKMPRRVGTAKDWSRVSVGGDARISFACATKSDGTAWCWGDDSYGQLGDGTPGDRTLIPTEVSANAGWSTVSAGGEHTCGLSADGSAWCWGHGSHGELGDGELGPGHNVALPTRVVGSQIWASIVPGADFTCGVTDVGSLWCWGSNDRGRLGIGDLGVGRVAEPRRLGTASDWSAASAGSIHGCATKLDGTAWCWGWGALGQLGDRAWTDAPAPVRVQHSSTWTAVDLGEGHSCGIAAHRALWCWGEGGFGAVGDGTTENRSTPVRI